MNKLLLMLSLSCMGVFAMDVKKEQITYEVRKGIADDKAKLKALYQEVAKTPGGLARTVDEITDEYIDKIMSNSLKSGLLIVAEKDGKIIGAMHKYSIGPKVFSHVLGEGTILVHPSYHGMGVGKKVITTFQDVVKKERPDRTYA